MLRRTASAALLVLLALSVSADSAQAPDATRFKDPTPPIQLDFDIGWTAGAVPVLPKLIEVLGTNITPPSAAGIDPMNARANLMGEPGGELWFDVPYIGFAVLVEVHWSCLEVYACPIEVVLTNNHTGSGAVAQSDPWTRDANGTLRIEHAAASVGEWTIQTTQRTAGAGLDGEVRVSLFPDGWVPVDYSAFD